MHRNLVGIPGISFGAITFVWIQILKMFVNMNAEHIYYMLQK